MTSPDDLRAARDSYSVALFGIIRDFKKDSSRIFIIVEGKDADYYRPRLSSILSDEIEKIAFKNVGGKNNEKKLINAIVNNDSLITIRYMAIFDRDYENDIDDIIHINHYVTPGYSVENFYTSISAVRQSICSLFFKDAAHADADSDTIEMLSARFEAAQKQFHDSVFLFNCWAWVQRHTTRSGSINLDAFDVNFYCIIDFDSGCVTRRYDLDDLNRLTPDRDPVTQAEISAAQVWFNQKSLRLANRGKQEIFFLFLFLNYVTEQASNAAAPFRRRTRCSKRVSQKEIISELSGYADTPPDFVEFLRDWRNRFPPDTP